VYNTKTIYQLIISITKCEIRKSFVPFGDVFLIIGFASTGETAVKRTYFTASD